MKFAIPTENDKLCVHFGSCKLFTFIEVDETSNKIVSTETKVPSGECHEYMASWVAENSADVVIAGGMGIPAQELLKNHGLNVVIGASVDTPENLVLNYVSGDLKTESISCSCDCSHH